ncbi:uncharacterized protein LOC131893607 [Tigriopus californicus]|uniref:uncharacterized protein LOC131893607 n=1 Tax=Tigriopus californicus TaxID=6832 RepID=UPI0027D9F43A|nr:uncharacterized protein LOC131893607 [Tigriopus californicus]
MERQVRLTVRILCLVFLLEGSQVFAQEQVLRYTVDSCRTLSPFYQEENYSDLNIGPLKPAQENEGVDFDTNKIVFKTPKKSTVRNPPFKLVVSATQYRRNRKYKVSIVAEEYFDSFMVQARGRPTDDGNTSHVGSWVDIPSIGAIIRCRQNPRAAVVDKGRPLKLGNLTFTWKAPEADVGPIQFQTSIALNDAYVTIASEPLTFNNFPDSTSGCGRTLSCFRVCLFTPLCDSDGVAYMLIMNRTKDNEIVFKLGGFLPNSTSYVAVGIGQDSKNLRNMDMMACQRDDNTVMLRHYLLEDSTSRPYRHRQRIRLQNFDVDRETDFVWCQFQRPINPSDRFDLDLTQRLHHFYFWGQLDNQSIPILPDSNRLFKSYYDFNISEVYNEIVFESGILDFHSAGQTLKRPFIIASLPLSLMIMTLSNWRASL